MSDNGIAAELAEVIGRAKSACRTRASRAATAYEQGEHKRGHDLSEATREEKRDLFRRAQHGHIGPEWQRVALRRDVEIGVFLHFYEHWSVPPTDEQLARMWPGTEAPRSAPPPPDRTYVEGQHGHGDQPGIDEW